jgi:dUTP pyrophosphatase
MIEFTGIEPTRAHPTDAGYDLYADMPVTIGPGGIGFTPTGTHIAIPDGYVGLIKDRSSLGIRGVHVLAGVLDSGFRGPIAVVQANFGLNPFEIAAGDRIAQLVIVPVNTSPMVRVEQLPVADRGDNGFGSTGQ